MPQNTFVQTFSRAGRLEYEWILQMNSNPLQPLKYKNRLDIKIIKGIKIIDMFVESKELRHSQYISKSKNAFNV